MSLLIDVMSLKLKSSQAISSGNSTTSRAILKAKSAVGSFENWGGVGEGVQIYYT